LAGNLPLTAPRF